MHIPQCGMFHVKHSKQPSATDRPFLASQPARPTERAHGRLPTGQQQPPRRRRKDSKRTGNGQDKAYSLNHSGSETDMKRTANGHVAKCSKNPRTSEDVFFSLTFMNRFINIFLSAGERNKTKIETKGQLK